MVTCRSTSQPQGLNKFKLSLDTAELQPGVTVISSLSCTDDDYALPLELLGLLTQLFASILKIILRYVHVLAKDCGVSILFYLLTKE